MIVSPGYIDPKPDSSQWYSVRQDATVATVRCGVKTCAISVHSAGVVHILRMVLEDALNSFVVLVHIETLNRGGSQVADMAQETANVLVGTVMNRGGNMAVRRSLSYYGIGNRVAAFHRSVRRRPM